MKRIGKWFATIFGWDQHPRHERSSTLVAGVREEHRRRIDGFNQALAAAANLQDLLRTQLDELRGKEARLQARLQKAVASADEQAGAQWALELQNLGADVTETCRRLDEAGQNAAELNQLRDKAIAKAKLDLQDASDLASRDRPDSQKRR